MLRLLVDDKLVDDEELDDGVLNVLPDVDEKVEEVLLELLELLLLTPWQSPATIHKSPNASRLTRCLLPIGRGQYSDSHHDGLTL